MTSFESRPLPARALCVGPAAAAALSRDRAEVRVHSVFTSIVNLEVEGEACLVALGGPLLRGCPHAVAMEELEVLTAAGLRPGDGGQLENGGFRLGSSRGHLSIDLSRASFPAPRTLPPLPRRPSALGACAVLLLEIQEARGCELRMDLGWGCPAPSTELGRRLRQAGMQVATAAEAASARDLGRFAAQPDARLEAALSELMGLGPGATPAGDDFLCGFLAAACARSQDGRVPAWLSEPISRRLPSTARLGASMLGWAMRGHWPAALVDFAWGLASGRDADATQALAVLCALGHSSGADIGTGFLAGLKGFAGEERAPP